MVTILYSLYIVTIVWLCLVISKHDSSIVQLSKGTRVIATHVFLLIMSMLLYHVHHVNTRESRTRVTV